MKNILVTLLLIVCCSCFRGNYFKEGVNVNIIPYLNAVAVDSFEYENKPYPGVIYLYARNINDSNYLVITPMQCVYPKEDLRNSFVYADKTFIYKGDSCVLNLLIDRKSLVSKNNQQTVKSCEEISFLLDDYDPESIGLLIKGVDDVEEIDLSTELSIEVITGERIPPPPGSYK